MFRREMTSKKGSLPPKEGDLTCMPQGQSARRFFLSRVQRAGNRQNRTPKKIMQA